MVAYSTFNNYTKQLAMYVYKVYIAIMNHGMVHNRDPTKNLKTP